MAGYGYGSWSQVSAPSVSSASASAFNSAGDLFNGALKDARQGIEDFQAAQKTALDKAKATNLQNLQLKLQGAATQGLEAYDPLQDRLTGQGITDIYGEYIDPLAAAAAAQEEEGRGAALSQTTKKLLAQSDQQFQDLQSGNLSALQQAAQDMPGVSQYLALDPSGSLVELPGSETEQGQAAINQFAQAASKYGFKPIDAPLQIRKNVEERLVTMGAEPQEIRSITDTFEKYQSDRNRLDADSKAVLDTQVTNLTTEYETQLANIDKLETDFFTQNGMSLDMGRRLGEASNKTLRAVVLENWPDDTVLPGMFGGEQLLQRIQEMREGTVKVTGPNGETLTKADLESITDDQIKYALLNVGETENLIFDEAVDFDKFANQLVLNAKGGVEDKVLKQRAAAYNSFADDKRKATDQYNANVSNTTRAVQNQAGFQNTRVNSQIIQAALARATQAKGAALTQAETNKVTSSARDQIKAATDKVSNGDTVSTRPNTSTGLSDAELVDISLTPEANTPKQETTPNQRTAFQPQPRGNDLVDQSPVQSTGIPEIDRGNQLRAATAAADAQRLADVTPEQIADFRESQSQNPALFNATDAQIAEAIAPQSTTSILQQAFAPFRNAVNQSKIDRQNLQQQQQEFVAKELEANPQLRPYYESYIKAINNPVGALNFARQQAGAGRPAPTPAAAQPLPITGSGRGAADNQITREAQRIAPVGNADYVRQGSIAPNLQAVYNSPAAVLDRARILALNERTAGASKNRVALLTASLQQLPTRELLPLLNSSLDTLTKQVITNILTTRQ